MSSKKQKDNNGVSFQRFLNSFKYSWEGLKVAYKNEQSLWLHAVCTIVSIILGIICHISFMEWAVILISLVVVLAIELVNTSIEAVVDLVTKEIHPLAKIAKDCASAATFVSSITAIIICIYILVPKIIALF